MADYQTETTAEQPKYTLHVGDKWCRDYLEIGSPTGMNLVATHPDDEDCTEAEKMVKWLNAAPDLLKALQNIAERTDVKDEHDDWDVRNELQTVIEIARAAYNNAKGEG